MSFSNYPAALPFILALHEKEALKKLIDELSENPITQQGQAVNIKEPMAKPVSHPFIDAFEKMMVSSDKFARTDIGGLTNSTSGDACLDLYYGIDIRSKHQTTLLENAWKQDSEMTLHIIFYTRSIHRGKSNKEAFLRAFCWLLENHPKTAITNLHVLIDGTIRTDAILQKEKRESEKKAKALEEDWDLWTEDDCSDGKKKEVELATRRDFKTHGYWKDLATIVNIYCQDEVKNRPFSEPFKALRWPKDMKAKGRFKINVERKLRRKPRQTMSPEERSKDVEPYIMEAKERSKADQKAACEKRRNLRVQRNEKVKSLLEQDKVYRALHLTVARLFAEQLQVDMAQLEVNQQQVQQGKLQQLYPLSNNLSLAAKWAPSLRASHDKHTFLATSIAEILFPPAKYQEKNESREHYLNKARDLYRKQYLVPLRAAIDLTEHHMAPGKWDTIDYRHVPATCMKLSAPLFFKHSREKLIEYMKQVAAGKKKVSGSTLTPNELVYKVREVDIPESIKKVFKSEPEVIEEFRNMEVNLSNGQWDTLLESLKNSQLIDNADRVNKNSKHVGLGECIALCDLSGSMVWPNTKLEHPSMLPYYAAIGLSLVIANLAKPPFNGKIISFTDVPEMFSIDTSEPLSNQVKSVEQSRRGVWTNVRAVFTDLLLPMAKRYNLRQEDMVKRIFIFSDMEFNCEYTRHEEFLTSYELIKEDYKASGYDMPELVWWNLALPDRYSDKLNAPVKISDKGVCLLSGYSSSMLKTFLDGDVEQEEEGESEPNKVKSDIGAVKSEEKKFTPKSTKENELSPVEFMKKAVYHESFNGLVVVD